MKKLDESKVRWIIRQKRAGMLTRQISRTMGISISWTKKIWARYRHAGDAITYPAPMSRPANGLPGRREHSAVLSAYCKHRYGAVRTEGLIEQNEGIHIPHNTIHGIIENMRNPLLTSINLDQARSRLTSNARLA